MFFDMIYVLFFTKDQWAKTGLVPLSSDLVIFAVTPIQQCYLVAQTFKHVQPPASYLNHLC